MLPAHALLHQAEDTTPYECDGLTAYRQRPLVVALPETEAQVQAVLKACHAWRAGGGARRRHRAVGRRDAHALGVTLSLAKFNRILKHRPGGPHGGRAVRRAQPRDQRSGRRPRPVLRARPLQPDRLHHRRQRGRELGRRALPEVRPDAAQRAEGARLHRRRRGRSNSAARRSTRPATTCWPCGRQRRHAGRHHRGHREAGAQAAAGALHHGQLRRHPKGRRRGGGGDRRRHHPGGPGDDGQADDGGGGGLRARRLRPHAEAILLCEATARRRKWKRKSAA
jgi:hypothetical protein